MAFDMAGFIKEMQPLTQPVIGPINPYVGNPEPIHQLEIQQQQNPNGLPSQLPQDWMHLPKPYVEPSASEVSIGSGPFARRGGEVIELTRYQQLGTVKIDGDTVTQQIGRGKTAEYSLAQLASHSKDPEMFAATMQYAADQGDSVKIDVHHGVSRVTDAKLESRLPQDFPFRDVVMRAAVTHGLDPRILGAVGMQESGMGKGENYDPVTKLGADKTGHGMWQMDQGYHSMGDCIRAGNDVNFAANKAAENLAGNIAQNGRDMGIQLYNGNYPDMPYTHLIDSRMETINHQVQQQSLEHGR